MSVPTQKKVELAYFEQFRALLSDFPSGDVEPSENPDFLVKGGADVLGIELTELHREVAAGRRPPQAQEAMRHRIMKRAQTLYTSQCSSPILVSAIFNDRIPITKTDVKRLADQLLVIVEEHHPNAGCRVELRREWPDRGSFPKELHQVAITNSPAITEPFFTSPGVTETVELTRADLDRAIRAKEPRIPVYRAKADQLWLLISSDIASMSTWFEPTDAALSATYTSGFDRIFVVRHFSNVVYELKL